MADKTILYFYLTILRHGETQENIDQVIQGHLDTELTNNGKAQAAEWKSPIGKVKPDLVISSDLKRAAVTASEAVNEVPLELESRLRERNFGELCGRTRSEVHSFTETKSKQYGGCKSWTAIGAECIHQLANRTHEFLVDLCRRLPLGGSENVHHKISHPVLGQSDLPPVPLYIRSISRTFQDNEELTFFNLPLQNYLYGGHILLVSHGGWIRQLLKILVFRSEQSYNFPRNCTEAVMGNCGICQIGLALHTGEFKKYLSTQHRPTSKISLTYDVKTQAQNHIHPDVRSNSCPFANKGNENLPLVAICYHFNLTSNQIADPSPNTVIIHPSEKPDYQKESLPDDDDEYTGLTN